MEHLFLSGRNSLMAVYGLNQLSVMDFFFKFKSKISSTHYTLTSACSDGSE